MVSNSKILTVSYGTFSCTLEGFDDSFGTMKAIAEYFRDLASNDRYFGAEPPTPDAEMLARIAEREIARQVDARQERGQIVLRASEQTHAADTAKQPAPHAEPQHDPETQEPDSEVQRTETAVNAPQSDDSFEPDGGCLPATPAEDELPNTEQEAPTDRVAPSEETEADFVSPAPVPPASDEENVAAKLRRIRAVVSKAQEPATAPLYTEDEHAEEAATDKDAFVPPATANVEVAPDTPAPTDEFSPIHEGVIAHGAEPAAPAGEEAESFDVDPSSDEVRLNTSNDEAAEKQANPPESAEPRAGVLKVTRDVFEGAVAPDPAPEDENAPLKDVPHSAESDTDDWTYEWFEEEESSLSPEEEAELRQELAQVEAELSAEAEDSIEGESKDEDDEIDSIFAVDPSEQPHESRHDRIARRKQLYQSAGEQDMKRLIDKTKTEMAEPQAANRRNAIAHLRAAVAATNAEVAAGEPAREDTITDAFRDDLASAVRPKRPEKPAKSSAHRPATGQSAPPLKLVAEQRIDDPKDAKPVRPRRVSRANLDEPLPESMAKEEFADFAASVGAQSLGEILEAAAAYLTFVEEREDFSRPQLMTKLRDVQGEAFSREDGLRSFGTLLRNGKLRKAGSGRFSASPEIGFQPEARRVG